VSLRPCCVLRRTWLAASWAAATRLQSDAVRAPRACSGHKSWLGVALGHELQEEVAGWVGMAGGIAGSELSWSGTFGGGRAAHAQEPGRKDIIVVRAICIGITNRLRK
jgi:hypothetical protein